MKFKMCLWWLLSASAMFGQVFKGESVEYDSIGHRFLTSDNGSAIVQRADDGTVSLFGSGTKADYGMEIINSILFTVSGSKVYAYDLITAEELAAISIPGASFLNGLASDGVSKLWVTDFGNGNIHEIDAADLSAPVVTQATTISGTPNGIVHDAPNNRLVVVTWGSNAKILSLDLANNYANSTLLTTSLTNIDGVDMDGDGNFFIASWSPDKIIKYNNNFTTSEEITVAGLNNPADICYALSDDTLAIPNTGGNNILFVGFGEPVVSSAHRATATFGLQVSPNPATTESNIIFELPVAALADIRILDSSGKEVFAQVQWRAAAGQNTIPLRDCRLAVGTYFCTVTIGNKTAIQQILATGL